MNILETVLKAGLNENVIGSLSQKTGIDSNSLGSLISDLAPQLLNGAKANLASDNDSSSLIDMISGTDLDKIAQNPEELDRMDTGGMLGQLFSSLNENESDVTNSLSQKSGIDASSIASLLPMLAPLVMGALNKKSNLGSMDTSNTNDMTSMLTNFIDQDNDGSVVDDLLGMAKRFL